MVDKNRKGRRAGAHIGRQPNARLAPAELAHGLTPRTAGTRDADRPIPTGAEFLQRRKAAVRDALSDFELVGHSAEDNRGAPFPQRKSGSALWRQTFFLTARSAITIALEEGETASLATPSRPGCPV